MGFQNSLKDLRELVFGSGIDSVEDAIEDVTKEILTKRKLKTTTVVELVNKIVKDGAKDNSPGLDGQKDAMSLLQRDLGRESFTVEGDRSGRYQQVDYILTNNPELAQALKVYVENVLSPDFFTKLAVGIVCILPQVEDTIVYEQAKRYMETLQKVMDVEDNITEIVTLALKYGDCFVEVSNPRAELVSYGILQEETIPEALRKEAPTLPEKEGINYRFQAEKHLCVSQEPKVLVEGSGDDKPGPPELNIRPFLDKYVEEERNAKRSVRILTEQLIDFEREGATPEILGDKIKDSVGLNKKESTEGEKKKDAAEADALKPTASLDDLRLIVHEPKFVLLLRDGDLVIGYLVLENRLAEQATATGSPGLADIVRTLAQRILTQASEIVQIPSLRNDPEALNLIYHILKKNKIQYNELTTRFVSPGSMEHFKNMPSKYKPYGETIFDPVLFVARLMTAMRVSLVIYRLSRAPEKRVFQIETGLNRDAAQLIEMVKTEMDRREITVDKIGTIDSISTILSTFESIYLPMTHGKEWVRMDTQQGGQLTDKVEDVNLILKELISGMGIPPALLGYEQDIESKATLAQQNVKFARAIIQIQKTFSHSLSNLYYKIVRMTEPSLLNVCKLTTAAALKPPRSLMVERLAELVEGVEKMSETFSNLGFPKEKLIQYFIGDLFDPDTIERQRIEEKAKKKILKSAEEEGEEGEGGGSGGKSGGGW